MNNVEQLEQELDFILVRLRTEDDQQKYEELLKRASEVQKILEAETLRDIQIRELDIEEKKLDQENEKIEIERSKLEIEEKKIKVSRSSFAKECIGAFLKGLVSASCLSATMLFTARMNNSGEILPNWQRDLITGSFLRK